MGAYGVPLVRAAKGESPSGANKPSSRFWHQGFGMIQDPEGRWVVPFIQEMTARRMASIAADNTGIRMLVIDLGGFWGYTTRGETT